MCFTGLCCNAAPATSLASHANIRAPLRLVTLFLCRAVLPEFPIIDLQHRCSFPQASTLCFPHCTKHCITLNTMVVLSLHGTCFHRIVCSTVGEGPCKTAAEQAALCQANRMLLEKQMLNVSLHRLCIPLLLTLLKGHSVGSLHSLLCSCRGCLPDDIHILRCSKGCRMAHTVKFGGVQTVADFRACSCHITCGTCIICQPPAGSVLTSISSCCATVPTHYFSRSSSDSCTWSEACSTSGIESEDVGLLCMKWWVFKGGKAGHCVERGCH